MYDPDHEEFGCARAVIQAYLKRSAADIDRLNKLGIPVRLCKGAYDEPATVAFATKREVDRNYVALMKTLLDQGSYPAIATHDEMMAGEAFRYVRERKIAADKFEFQMLYGIRRDLQKRIVDLGYTFAPLRALRDRMVSVFHAPAGGASGERPVPGTQSVPLISRRKPSEIIKLECGLTSARRASGVSS